MPVVDLGLVGLNQRGPWDPQNTYHNGDRVPYNGGMWVAITPVQGSAPASDTGWVREPGIGGNGEGDGGNIIVTNEPRYEIGEFYNFRYPVLRAGFAVRNGAALFNANVLHPKLYEYLQSAAGQHLCLTQAMWDKMSTAEPWHGVGGVPYFVVDTNSRTIRVPDTRGMYWEDAGFDGLEVGGVHGDQIQTHCHRDRMNTSYDGRDSGANYYIAAARSIDPFSTIGKGGPASLDGVPVRTGAFTKPRAFGVLPCVYVGGES